MVISLRDSFVLVLFSVASWKSRLSMEEIFLAAVIHSSKTDTDPDKCLPDGPDVRTALVEARTTYCSVVFVHP